MANVEHPSVAGSPTAHPQTEALIAYHHRQLDEAAAAAIGAHLADCRHCRELLVDLEDFVRAERAAAPAEDVVAARLVARATFAQVRLERWRRGALLAASIAVAAAIPSALQLWPRDGGARDAVAEGLEVNLLSVSLHPASSLRGDDGNRVALPAGAQRLHVVLLTDDDLPPDRDFRLEIFDAAGRRVVAANGLQPTPVGTFSIGVPAATIPPGRYVVRLRAFGRGGASVSDYPLEVVRGGDSRSRRPGSL